MIVFSYNQSQKATPVKQKKQNTSTLLHLMPYETSKSSESKTKRSFNILH